MPRLVAWMLAAALALAVGAVPAAAKLTVHGSVRQVQVVGLKGGAKVTLLGRKGKKLKAQRADAQGGALFRGVRPGRGYRVRAGGKRSGPIRVLTTRSAPPSTKLYGQKIPISGYGYLRTRDGTQLAINVHPPVGALGDGPFPTLIEYSGYGYANPDGAESSIEQVATLLGFAVVDVNMRGTGCSGGAFDFFEPLQGLDGYDVIETVARQPWVMHHKVGMVGISYGGISQLFVGETRPPSLAAIAPLSVIDNTQTTLYPGGVLNTGFAVNWGKERAHDAEPASATGGQPWALKRIQQGDTTCAANQALHGKAVDLLGKIRRNHFYNPKVADPLSPVTFVHKIDVPVFMACQWTDEQTGGHCPTLPAAFTGTRRKWFTFTNGTHIDSLDPETFNRWFDFLSLFVARVNPRLPPAALAGAPAVYQEAMGVPGVTLPGDPIQNLPTYADALAAFERLPAIRVLFDSGAGGLLAGMPYPGYEKSFSRLPVPGTKGRAWYFGPGGALGDGKPARAGTDRFKWTRTARPPTDFTGATDAGGLWQTTPNYDWTQSPPGTAASYVTAPLTQDTTVIGAGAVTAWVKSSNPHTDLQATISEVRPDGRETFVQSGWLRGDARVLDKKKSTKLAPVLSLRKRDARTLSAKRFSKVTIPLYYEGHAFRTGSRLRVTIQAPSGDQPIWAFAEATPRGSAKVAIARSKTRPSGVLLPVVPGLSIPTPLPPCPGLRGEPCRPYVAYKNG